MRAFSYNNFSAIYAARVLQCMRDNYGYIAFFNKQNIDEAFQRIFYQAVKSEKTQYTDLTPYIKSLARNVMKIKNKETPYALFNEDGEVAIAFTGLITEDLHEDEEDYTDVVKSQLEELYLQYPSDFMLIKDMIPTLETPNVKAKVKNEDLKKKFFNLMHEYGGKAVFSALVAFLKEIMPPPSQYTVQPTYEEKIVDLKPADYYWCKNLTDKKWVCTKEGVPIGIDADTLRMENDYNIDFVKFRMAQNTSCTIWRMDCSSYFADIEDKIYAEKGVNNKYIFWCNNKYKLTTPAGTVFIDASKEKYMEIVRHELILSLLAANLGTIIAVSPDNIYFKMNKASSCANIKMKATDGTIYRFPMEIQETERCK